MQGKLSMLFESINAISNAKNLEDKYQFQINEQHKKIEILLHETSNKDVLSASYIEQIDKIKEDLSETVKTKHKMDKDKFHTATM